MSPDQGTDARILGLCRSRRRAIFVVYALLTFTATHWPRLELPLPGHRPDILVHMGVFGLWTALFLLAAFFGPVFARRNILIGGLVSLVYSALDEASQGLPGINRQPALDDALANAAGVVIMVLIFVAIARRRAASAVPARKPMTRE